jgi:hypothetical protein
MLKNLQELKDRKEGSEDQGVVGKDNDPSLWGGRGREVSNPSIL